MSRRYEFQFILHNVLTGYTCNDGVNGDGYCTSDAYDPVDDFTSQNNFDPHIAHPNFTKSLAGTTYFIHISN